MIKKNMVPIEAEQEQIWVLLPGRTKVRMMVPDLPIAGLSQPLRVHMDFDAGVVDQIIERLTVLRAQMLPKPPAPRKRH
jgi:hypothetical protein